MTLLYNMLHYTGLRLDGSGAARRPARRSNSLRKYSHDTNE